MALTRYWGYSPQRVGKDTKYSVTAAGEVKLEYQETTRVRWLLATGNHPELVRMVNSVKTELTSREGGAFYINEFQAVLVPDGAGQQTYWAGEYEETLEFRDGDLRVSPVAAPGLRAGDPWMGPRVGIKYVLVAGGDDIRYEKIDGRRRETVFLSDDVGPSAANRTAKMVATVKGSSGGVFFVNECRELFAPMGPDVSRGYSYIGNLEGLPWFNPPTKDEGLVSAVRSGTWFGDN
ncbi:hypothetical protein AAII07_07705 [Microvirga sp. 0TCS3.31]